MRTRPYPPLAPPPSPASSQEADVCSPDGHFGEPEGAGAGVSSRWVAKLCDYGSVVRVLLLEKVSAIPGWCRTPQGKPTEGCK